MRVRIDNGLVVREEVTQTLHGRRRSHPVGRIADEFAEPVSVEFSRVVEVLDSTRPVDGAMTGQ